MRFAALSVLSGVVLFSLDVTAQAYNWSITDQSPLITYNPLRVGDNTTTWNSTYSNSSWADQQLAGYSSLVGHGQSAHTTDFAGATASVGFVGTAVYVWGQAFQLSSVLYVDGVSRSFSGGQDGIIGSVEGLANGWHDVEVNVRGLGFVQVEGFTFTSDIGSLQVSNATIDVPLASLGDTLNLTGNWNVQYATVQDALTGQETNYTTLSTSADSSTSITLTPPANTSMMFLYGIIDPFSTSYTVSLSPEQGSADNAPSDQTYNASAAWVSGNQVMYQAQLNVGVQYTARITFETQATYLGSSFGLASIVYVQPSNSTDSAGLSKGAIAGIVIGSLVFVAVLAFLLFVPVGRRLRARIFACGSRDSTHRRTSIISQPPGEGGISPYPIPLSATRHHDSESSVAKVALQESLLAHTPTSAEPSSAAIEDGRSEPSSGQTASAQAALSTNAQRLLVSRQEKEASLAILLPHLGSHSGQSTSLNDSPTTSSSQIRSPLREVDAGPVEREDLSPMLPPEYQPSWAHHRRDGTR